MQHFGWVGENPVPPPQWDLRLLGWRLATGGEARSGHPGYPLLIDHRMPYECLAGLVGRDWIVLLGVESSADRARLVAEGFAESLAGSVSLAELAARSARVASLACKVPRCRKVGPATLDLCRRDARVAERWVRLNPREFELFWCLSAQGGARMSRRQLLKDVWHLDHDPETNRVEVHISRLRSKLALAGAGEIIGTDPARGYFVRNWALDPNSPMRDEARPGVYTPMRV